MLIIKLIEQLQDSVTIILLSSRAGYRSYQSCEFTRSYCLIYIKSGNIVKKSGEKWRKIIKNRRNFHKVNIDTVSRKKYIAYVLYEVI